MTQSLILAIDQGGQSSRVAVYDFNGQQLHCFSALCETQNYVAENSTQHFIEQNPDEILAGILECVKKIQTALGDDARYLVAAGFAGQGSSLLCWDNQTGKALTPVLSWQDVRGEKYLQQFPFTHEQIQSITGLRISPHYGASKIRWCLENNSKVVNALKQENLSVGPIVSYLFYHLLNSKDSVDPGHAQRTLLWNLKCNDWDDSLLNLFNIPKSILPRCLYHDSDFGDLLLDDFKIPFTASARDQGASLFARGLPEKDACYINIGTGAFIQRLSESLHAPDGLLISPLWLSKNKDDKKYYAWEATVNGAASAIPFMQQQTALEISVDQINTALNLNPQKDCCFLNAIGGLSAPYWRTDLQSMFSENLSSDEKILTWLESIIFQIVVNVELMSALGETQKIYISGGLSKADGICQKIADLTHAEVYRSENSDATLQGIAYLAAGMPSEWRTVIDDEIFYPQQNVSTQSRFALWKKEMNNWLAHI